MKKNIYEVTDADLKTLDYKCNILSEVTNSLISQAQTYKKVVKLAMINDNEENG